MSRAFLYFFGLSWLLHAVPASAMIERRVEHRFEVPADKASLSVDTFSGLVHVTSVADGNAIEVLLIQAAEVDTEKQMDDKLKLVKLDMVQKGGEVKVSAQYRKWIIPLWEDWPPVALTYEIRVPRRCQVQVRTRDGGIVIGAIEGNLVLNNESGAIFTEAITGSVTATSRSGGIGITAATGAITATTSLGNITVGRAGGATKLSSKGGYIELQRASGEVTVRGSGSDANVGFVSPIKHPADISVSGGDVTIVMESECDSFLDLNASVFGHVSFDGNLPFKFTGDPTTRSAVKGMANAGGPRIWVRADGGNVRVRGFAPLATNAAAIKSGLQ